VSRVRITKRTPGRFRTRVITDGVVPSLPIDYKSSDAKQYHKERRALRTEATTNATRHAPLLSQRTGSAHRRLPHPRLHTRPLAASRGSSQSQRPQPQPFAASSMASTRRPQGLWRHTPKQV
jgi:hypothetical protein